MIYYFALLIFTWRKFRDDRRHRFQRIIATIRRARWASLLLLSSILIGTLGYIWIEEYTFLDAWYMSIITLATVGFAEVHPLSEAGRVFTSFLILFNVGIFAYAISSLVSIFTEGGFVKMFSEFSMYRAIESLDNHVIICGYGRHSFEVTQELDKQGTTFVVVENNPDKIEALREHTNYLYVEGDATLDAVLEEAGVRRARAMIITLPDDADVVFIVLSARQLNPQIRIIARANNLADEIKMRRAGADQTVNPERIGGFYMATLLDKPDLVEFFRLLSNMGPSNVVFEEIDVKKLRQEFVGKSLSAGNLYHIARVSIVAIRYPNGQYELNPLPDTVLRPDLHIVVLGNPEQMQRFRQSVLIGE